MINEQEKILADLFYQMLPNNIIDIIYI